MKNEEVIKEFGVYGCDERVKTKHLFFEGDVLFSYSYHYPLAIRVKNGFIINKSGYSMTTATHTNTLIRFISNFENLKQLEKAEEKGEVEDIELMTTQELKELIGFSINVRFMTLQEIKKAKILKGLENGN